MTRIQVYGLQAQRRINAAVKRLESTPFLGQRRSAPSGIPSDRLRILNETGADLELGQVVQFKNAIFSADTALADFRDYVGMVGIVPEAGVGDDWGIVTNFIATEEMGLIAIDGVHLAKVNMISAAHTWANPTVGTVDYLTSSGTTGLAEILEAESGTGEKWAYVRIDRQATEGVPVAAATANFFTSGTITTTGGMTIPLNQSVPHAVTDPNYTLDGTNSISVGETGIYEVGISVNILPWTGPKGAPHDGTFDSKFNLQILRRQTSVGSTPGSNINTIIDQLMNIVYHYDGDIHLNKAGQGTIVAPQFSLGAQNVASINAGEVVAMYIDAEEQHSFNDTPIGETVVAIRRAG